MRSYPVYTCLTLSTIFHLSTAWPVMLGQPERREPASYSVVAVDGGSSGGGDGSATTVVSSVVHTETVMVTQLSTIVVTESDTPSTLIVTITSAYPTTVTEQIAPSIATQTVTFPPETTAEPSQAPAPDTVTVTQPLPSSKPYDDGMWHTHYYYTVTEETSSLPSSTANAIDSLPSLTRGLGLETISASPEPSYTSSTTSSSTTFDWASFWRAVSSDSPTETASSSSVAAPTVSTAIWDGRPDFAPSPDTNS